jgi:hypothetical protein
MWPDVEFFKLNREPADVDRVSVAREVAEGSRPFLRVRGRPASGSRRKRRWNACGSAWRNPSFEMQFSMPDQWSRHSGGINRTVWPSAWSSRDQ